jgi:SET domain-containing protein
MLLFETELRPSPIHGIGVFLLEPVKAGDVIWRFDSRVDRVYTDSEIASLPPLMRRFLRTYSTRHEGMKVWILCGDNGRHFNHSDAPNTISRGIAFGDDIAACDLAAGTELTSDYRTICDSIRLEGFEFDRGALQAAEKIDMASSAA